MTEMGVQFTSYAPRFNTGDQEEVIIVSPIVPKVFKLGYWDDQP